MEEKDAVPESGNYLPAAFMCIYESLGIDRILLATDYPYEDSNECMHFLDELPITPKDREKIYSQNADQFGISGGLPAKELASQAQSL